MSSHVSFTGLVFLGIAVSGCAGPSKASPHKPDLGAQQSSIVSEQASAKFDPKAYGAVVTDLFYAGEDDEIWLRFSSKMKLAMKSKEAWTKMRESLLNQVGKENELVREDSVNNEVNRLYWRLARFDKVPVPLHLMWTFDPDQSISGFSVKPEQREAESKYLDYRPKTQLRLPFTDEWYVFWGGRNVLRNYHAAARDQRFAYDFLVVKDGSTHLGDGTSNSDYYCDGKPVVAPAAGEVFAMGDGIKENLPGQKNSTDLLGNYVILDHKNGEYSFFAHFKTNTVAVRKGEQVQAGRLLGQCGNSGHSTEPHLHYHLQDTSELFKGEGLPIFFRDYTANGVYVNEGEPVQGERIQPGGRLHMP